MMILTRSQALACMVARDGHRLEPRLTADGTLAIPDSVATHPRYSDLSAVFATATTGPVASWAYEGSAIVVDDKQMTMNNMRKSYSLTNPSGDVFRMEVRANDGPLRTDLFNNNRRSEIVSDPNSGWSAGQTFWQSWATILGPHPGLVLTDIPQRFGYVMQIHSGLSSRPPICVVNMAQNALRVYTNSDAAAPTFGFTERYSGALPAQGAVSRFVTAITPGENGHLSVWLNGTQIVDTDLPMGYYNTQSGPIAYPQWGIYTRNWNTSDVVYHANIEWGSTSLAARITAPLAVPDLSPWN
ncbi:hypothetical protein SEA_MURP_32 [Gordonia phage Murp]|nr:hypothetical protein SEA_MURP_32 [Gordonia phage Murp]